MALQDVESELERLRVKAAGKVRQNDENISWSSALIQNFAWPGPRVSAAALLRFAQAQDEYPGAPHAATKNACFACC
jgi:hypothetical protein